MAKKGRNARPPGGNRAARRRSGKTRRNSRSLAWISIVVVLAVVGGLVTASLIRGNDAKAQPRAPAPASVVRSMTNIPASSFDRAGVGSGISAPSSLPASTPALTADGRPEVFYLGAEYCPYCASERWAMVAALSRFGKFTGLNATASSTSDVYPGTKTFSFYRSSYSSPYLVFTPVEVTTNQPLPGGGGYEPLMKPTDQQRRLIATYDAAPYVQGQSGSIPFVDVGGRFIVSGLSAKELPPLLQGLSMSQIARQASDPTTPIGTNVLGTANLLSAAICQVTGNKPGSVCSSPAVVHAASLLGS